MTLVELAEAKKEERVLSACAIHANKAPRELMEVSVGQFKGR